MDSGRYFFLVIERILAFSLSGEHALDIGKTLWLISFHGSLESHIVP